MSGLANNLIDAAAEEPDRVALSCGGFEFTYSLVNPQATPRPATGVGRSTPMPAPRIGSHRREGQATHGGRIISTG